MTLSYLITYQTLKKKVEKVINKFVLEINKLDKSLI
jgi:hypothetical protein